MGEKSTVNVGGKIGFTYLTRKGEESVVNFVSEPEDAWRVDLLIYTQEKFSSWHTSFFDSLNDTLDAIETFLYGTDEDYERGGVGRVYNDEFVTGVTVFEDSANCRYQVFLHYSLPDGSIFDLEHRFVITYRKAR